MSLPWYKKITMKHYLGVVLASFTLLAAAKSNEPSYFKNIQANNVINIVSRDVPPAYYAGIDGPTGFEYDLARLFAEHIGVKLNFILRSSLTEVIHDVETGNVDIAAASIAITDKRKETLSFGYSYLKVRQQIAYHKDTPAPKLASDLIGRRIDILASSSHVEIMSDLQEKYPGIRWREHHDIDVNGLLALLQNKESDFVILNSHDIGIHRRYFPEIKVGFDMAAPRSIAWAFGKDHDNSLKIKVEEFFELIKQDGRYLQIFDRHFAVSKKFNYSGIRRFMRHAKQRLPKYITTFKEAGRNYGVDWRLLAAIGYQESRWMPDAVSFTKVKGIMMLTKPTAREIGINDRRDPEESITGGAKYFLKIKKRISENVVEPDRTWMTLAAYNVGVGHLNDARKLAVEDGSNPNRWIKVKNFLPLLSKKKFYEKTKYGYARGNEPVIYVENVRNYYDLLMNLTNKPVRKEPYLVRITLKAVTNASAL
jgi:membrane-bound lytic murein transglycosylase F